jgi:hypothetical protein
MNAKQKTSTRSYYSIFYKGQGLMLNDKQNDPKVLYLGPIFLRY